MKYGIVAYRALLLSCAVLAGAQISLAAIVVSPTENYTGAFTVQSTEGFMLYDPVSGAESYADFCTASSTPLTDDCDVYASQHFGNWFITDSASSSPGSPQFFNFLSSTSTADSLWTATIHEGGKVVSEGWPIVMYVGGFMLALFLALLMMHGMKGGVDRSRRR